MACDIVKTWPGFMEPEKVRRIFNWNFGRFYFSLGRGTPKRELRNMWFCHRGLLLGYFRVESVAINDGSLPKLRSLENRKSEWQFKHDVRVAVCLPPMRWLDCEVFHESFRGWRYFDFDSYARSIDAKVRI